MWLHSSVGRASHRYRGGHRFESCWSPDFFRLLLFNWLNWKIYGDDHSSLWSTTAVHIWIILHIFHAISLHGRYELNKLTSHPMCGFIAQLVEHCIGIVEVTGSNPVEALIFSGFFLNWKINCDDHSSLSSTTTVQIWITTVFVYTRLWKTKKPAGNISKISVSLACYWQIRLKSTNSSH